MAKETVEQSSVVVALLEPPIIKTEIWLALWIKVEAVNVAKIGFGCSLFVHPALRLLHPAERDGVSGESWLTQRGIEKVSMRFGRSFRIGVLLAMCKLEWSHEEASLIDTAGPFGFRNDLKRFPAVLCLK